MAKRLAAAVFVFLALASAWFIERFATGGKKPELGEKFSRHSSKTQALEFATGEEKQHFLGLGASQ